nr:hypothetical protein [Occultella kanbiaonis]
MASHWLEQDVALRCDIAAQDYTFGIKDAHDAGDSGGDDSREPIDGNGLNEWI